HALVIARQHVDRRRDEPRLILRLGGGAETYDRVETIHALQALDALRERGEETQRVLGILHERLHLRIAGAGGCEARPGVVHEIAWRGVVDRRVRDGDGRYRRRARDEHRHGRLDGEAPGKGDPGHICELLGQHRVRRVRVDAHALGEISPLLLVTQRVDGDTAYALSDGRRGVPFARALRGRRRSNRLGAELDAAEEPRYPSG